MLFEQTILIAYWLSRWFDRKRCILECNKTGTFSSTKLLKPVRKRTHFLLLIAADTTWAHWFRIGSITNVSHHHHTSYGGHCPSFSVEEKEGHVDRNVRATLLRIYTHIHWRLTHTQHIEICHSSECAHLFTHSFSLFVWSLTWFATFKSQYPSKSSNPNHGNGILPNRFGETGSRSLTVQSVSKGTAAPHHAAPCSVSQQKTSKSPNQEEKEQQQPSRRWCWWRWWW